MVYVLFVACLLGLFTHWLFRGSLLGWLVCSTKILQMVLLAESREKCIEPSQCFCFYYQIQYLQMYPNVISVFFRARCTTKTFRFFKHFYTD